MTNHRFQAVLFDWGDTIMYDDLAMSTPMVTWPQVRAVEGVAALLEYLQAAGCLMALATSADISNQVQIYGALARVNFDKYFSKIYCIDSIGLKKTSQEFYPYILDNLKLDPKQTLMVGDNFEYDVLAPNRLGISAVWYNPRTSETSDGDLYFTIHWMAQLLAWFQRL